MTNEMLESKFKPLGSLILIRRDAPKTEIGSIKLPQRSVHRSQFGTVIATGPGAVVDGKLLPLNVQVGDYVMFDQLADRFIMFDQASKTATLLSDDFEDYALVLEQMVMGVIG